eukprot:c53848_g1_i1.p1 GENE.c53848_g1_i1~~c53848_g1_i1.p1  ORF type:complete len:313 (+),score=55.75 c53848_g1_i1:53-991(+)
MTSFVLRPAQDLAEVRKAVLALLHPGDHADVKDGWGSSVSEEIADWADDACITTFLNAHHTPHKAASVMHSTIKWRIATRPQFSPCPLCSVQPNSHSMRLAGFDDNGRAVIYSNFAHAKDRFNPTINMTHLCYLLESCLSLGKRVGWAERWVWVVDFQGFGIRDCDPRSSRLTSHLLAHYPDRLGAVLLVDAPKAFSGIWKVIKGIIDEVTRSKVHFISSDKARQSFTAVGIGAEMTDWLTTEMFENREKESEDKAYWESPSSDGMHDPRGVKSYVDSPHFTPLYPRDLVKLDESKSGSVPVGVPQRSSVAK